MIKKLFIFLCAATLILSGSFFSTAEAQLTAPTLSATAVSNSQINLSWTDSNNGVHGYVIERSLNPSSGFVTIADVDRKATSYNNVGLNSGTTYYYRINAYKQNDSSPYSNIASATTQAGASVPNTPSSLTASAVSASQINLLWHDNSNNETGFKIQRATSSGGPWAQIATVGANATSYSNSGLSASTTYYYRVLAYNSTGNSSYSNTASATTQSGGSATIPVAPSNLTANAVSSSQITLAWQDNSNNETGFQIWRYNASAGWSQIANVGANTSSYSNAGLSSSTTYYYYVLAYNSAGNSANSNTASATTQSGGSLTVPNAPDNLDANAVSSSQINLTWQDNSNNETSFEIWRYKSGIGWITLPIQSANVTSYADAGLSPSTLYYYVVRAVNSAGSSSWSNVATATTLSGPGSGDTTPPSVSITSPSSGSTYTTSQTITIYAYASDNVGVTRVEFYDNGVLKGTDTTNQYTYAWTVTSSDNSTHSWTAKAYDAAGNFKISTAVSLTVNIPVADTTPPTVPTLTASAVSCSQVNLFWTASTDSGGSGLKGYRVYRGGAYIKQVLAPSTSTSDTNLSSSTSYSYRVSAIDNAGNESAQSNAAVTSTSACADTIAPTVSITSPASGVTYTTAQTVTITASASDNVEVTRVEFYDNGVLKGTDTTSTYTYTWTFTAADNGTHNWTAKAYDAAGNSANSSAVSLTVNIASSSSGQYIWAEKAVAFSSSYSAIAYGVAVDASGNAITTGQFTGSVDFGCGTLTSSGANDIFIAKYSPMGSCLWSKHSVGSSALVVSSVATDGSSNVLVTGQYYGSRDFGGGTLSSAGQGDIYIAKYSPTGAYLWAKTLGGISNDRPYSIGTDNNNNIIVTGYFVGTVDFGGGPLTSAGLSDVFIAKYSPTGAFLWAMRIGGSNSDVGLSLATNSSGDITITGTFKGTVDFGGGPQSNAGRNDIFVAKYSSNGAYLWSRSFGSTTDDYGYGVAVDGYGNVLLTGTFTDTIDFGGGPMSPFGGGDIFLAKYSPTGQYIWAEHFGSSISNASMGYSVSVDGSNNIVLTGTVIGNIQNIGDEWLLDRSGGTYDILLAKFSPDGVNLWAKRFGADWNDYGRAVAADTSGNVFLVGDFYVSVDFGGGTLTSSYTPDAFIAKFTP
jgi:hypothetical protein